MGSVKFKDLKAYVRYDGNGRVVAGSMVFRKKKPKNGRWYEISSNLCCNAGPNPGTTTTTTTQGGGSVTPTEFIRGYWTNTLDACNTTTSGDVTFYSASSVLAAGVTVYVNAALTIPLYEGWVIYEGATMTSYVVGAGGVLSLLNCSEVTTTTTTTTQDPNFYYIANRYECTNCGTPVETDVLIKLPVNFGSGPIWVSDSVTTNEWYITNSAPANPSAILINVGGWSTGCSGC